jgi:hypothetical protein
MKIKPTFNIQHSTSNSEGIRVGPARTFDVGRWKLNVECSPLSRHPQKGVALIITVILLAVVTFMALTFLAISRRERGAVTTTTDTASARLAADDALASAEAQIVANILATTNPYNFGLIVSTNYLPPTTSNSLDDLTNLFINPRTPVWLSNTVTRAMENRFYLDLNRNAEDDPNGWVTNRDNLNRVILDASGNPSTNFEVGDPDWIGVLLHPDQPYGPNNPFVARYAFIAVPIGNALDLNAIYNDARQPDPTMRVGNDGFLRNQGVGSWEINLAAFLTDLNTNEWDPITDPYTYNYLATPNRGAGFEDSLALLKYRYGGVNGTFNNLASANNLFGLNAANTFPYDGIDAYVAGPLMTGFQLPGDNDNTTFPWSGADNTNHFFDMQELFNTTETSVGTAPAAPNVTTRLLAAGGSPFFPNSTYNRYTYYRLLSQMGVESAPEQDKINLNYSNAAAYFDANGVVTNITFFPGVETNFTPWTPLPFFTIAADKMLREYSQEWQTENPSNFVTTFNVTNAFGITNIPVLVSNQFVYTPAVQRVLQLAANIYDATTNNTAVQGTNFPSVFRPIFEHDNFGNVFIVGYTTLTSPSGDPNTVSGTGDPQLALPYDIASITNLSPNFTPIRDANGLVNVYGVPWIIGAKKGFPNFNEFAMESVFQLTRKLQVTRQSTNDTFANNPSHYNFNQMFNLSLSNQFGVECWNSYTNDFLRSVGLYVTCTSSLLLTNDENFSEGFAFTTNGSLLITSADNSGNGWPGYNPTIYPLMAPLSFQLPLNTSIGIIPTSIYRFNSGAPFLTTNLDLPFETGGQQYPQPHWWLMTTNNVRVIILDGPSTGPNHVIDYVQLSGPDSTRDLTTEIVTNYDAPVITFQASGSELWNTNYQSGLPISLVSQVGVSMGTYTADAISGAWDQTDPNLVADEIAGFSTFMGYTPPPPYSFPGEAGEIALAQTSLSNQAPYTPTATVVEHFSWQANDPLVHYTADDLNWSGADRLDRAADDLTNEDLGKLNQRYMPWGGNPLLTGADQNPFNLALKDPLVWQSDDWDFPTYKMPTVGWLGRIHRGTPWQTVYLKASDILQQTNTAGVAIGTNTWMQWTGDAALASGQFYDAVNTAPAQDRLLFDNFTTAFNDNATRGTLSVNVGASDPGNLQAGLAAWSALLGGVIALSNNAVDAAVSPSVIVQHNGSLPYFTSFPINPAGPGGISAALGQIVTNINLTRAFYTNADGLVGTFEHAGDVLSAPQLAEQSPFLNLYTNGVVDGAQLANGISDEMYEWLPQQMMSLVRVSGTPQSPVRYVIYSYGQALKPAPNGIYTGSGQFFGMVTNYQVVAEAATRTVLRYDGTRVNSVVLTNVGAGVTNLLVVPSITNNQVVIERFNTLPSN